MLGTELRNADGQELLELFGCNSIFQELGGPRQGRENVCEILGASMLPREAMAGIADDREKPSRYRRRPAERLDRPRGGPKRLLHGIFGVLGCPAEPQAIPEDGRAMGGQHRLQCSTVAVSSGTQRVGHSSESFHGQRDSNVFQHIPGGPRRMVSEHQNTHANVARIAREALEQVCSGARSDCISEYYSPEFVDHVNDFELRGHAGVRRSVQLYRKLLSRMSIVVVEQVADGERVASRFVVNGIAHGRAVSFNGITISHVKDGRIVEDWSVTDTLGMLRQLGLWRALGVLLRSAWSARPASGSLTSRA